MTIWHASSTSFTGAEPSRREHFGARHDSEAQHLLAKCYMQAYDLFTSRVADDALVDIQLVGDSLANVVLGGLLHLRRF
mgnify:CR=1 FL=1